MLTTRPVDWAQAHEMGPAIFSAVHTLACFSLVYLVFCFFPCRTPVNPKIKNSASPSLTLFTHSLPTPFPRSSHGRTACDRCPMITPTQHRLRCCRALTSVLSVTLACGRVLWVGSVAEQDLMIYIAEHIPKTEVYIEWQKKEKVGPPSRFV